VSEWADTYRYLSPEASAEPGRWNTERNEPMRAIMDAVSDDEVETIVIMTSSQVGKTETLLNIIGYHIHQDPAPMLLIMPTLELGESFSKDRLATMIRDTPVLRSLVGDPRTRDSGNTLLHKTFPGGHITIAGSNSPASLASRPIRIVLCDEVDRYKPSAGTEGDPVNLARKRATTFWNRKFIMVSTPGIKGASRIEKEWNLSDQCYGFVPCEDCEEWQKLEWKNVRWDPNLPHTARYVCPHCGSLWDDPKRWRAIHKIEYRSSAPFRGVRGFHINEIYSPWVRLGEMAQAFVDAKVDSELLKTFVNTSLGETFEYDAEKIDAHQLMARVEDWGDKLPDDVLVVTCGVDVQADRLELELVGWGVDEESWSLDYKILYGDPSAPDIWSDLDKYLLETHERTDGTMLPVHATCVDHGGHHAAAVSHFVRDRMRRRVYAIKGSAGPGKPIWPKRATKTKLNINLFVIGVDPAKDATYAKLKVKEPGPGFAHFPIDRDQAYFEQLTAEQIETKYVKGFPTRVYFLPGGRRNEALDTRVYAYAALQSLNVRWGRLLAMSGRTQPLPSPPPRANPAPQQQLSPPAVNQRVPPRGEPNAGLGSPHRRVRKSGWMA
jgi:phage terminase large subunit GpA-like protein